ncbi:RNA polymerase sigma factor [Pedobacter duraquae]|uniref:RNA polymerase sigma factor n=1 Tax=Pedobacter duraquae TaxID=425511 RepID=A0A4R6INX7_9SPHI|nr:sigma-70 family RNA polymerase sigma factor [Pedobacter duraquae]TDO23962.1 RNA polymerase sigma-70 factor (ECF subfamily) [Pedobacter duraquae]
MDHTYIRKVCNGDTEAYRYFLKEYKDMAFSVALSVVKDEFIAEEVVQDAFMKAFRGMNSFNFQAKFSTWFYRIVTNEAFMRLNKIKKEIMVFTSEFEADIPDGELINQLHQDEYRDLVNEALKMLAPKESLVLRLFYLEEESIKAVCEITGWTNSNTKVTLHRARKSMLKAVNQLLNKLNQH